MRSAIIFLGNNFYYQLYRFYAKTIYGGPVAPYELTHYLYSKASPRDGWTHEEYMQRRQCRWLSILLFMLLVLPLAFCTVR